MKTITDYFSDGGILMTPANIALFSDFYSDSSNAIVENILENEFPYRIIYNRFSTNDKIENAILCLFNFKKYEFTKLYNSTLLNYDPLKNMNYTINNTQNKTNTGTQNTNINIENSGNDTTSDTETGNNTKNLTEGGTNTTTESDTLGGNDVINSTDGATNTGKKNTYDNSTLQDITEDTTSGTNQNTTTYGKTDNKTITENFGKTENETDSNTLNKSSSITYGKKENNTNLRTDNLNEGITGNQTYSGYQSIDFQKIIEGERTLSLFDFLHIIAENIINYITYDLFYEVSEDET